MKYTKSDAKKYAKQNMKGVWGGSLTPFTPKYAIDEEGFRFNIRYCIDGLQLGGMYVNALQGESWYWTQCLGMAGGDGRVRLPHVELTDAEKRAIKAAVESTELV